MPSDLQITNIKDQANANSAITIASDGQITVNQNNPTLTLGANTTFPSGSILKVFHDEIAFSSSVTTTTSGYVWDGITLDITGVSTSDKMLVSYFLPDCYNNATSNRRLNIRVRYSTNNFADNTQFGSSTDIFQDLGQINQGHVLVVQATGYAYMQNPATDYKIRLHLKARTGNTLIASAGTGLGTLIGYNIKA